MLIDPRKSRSEKQEKEKKSGLSDSNQRPRDTSSLPLGVSLLQSHALPTELRPADVQSTNLYTYIPHLSEDLPSSRRGALLANLGGKAAV